MRFALCSTFPRIPQRPDVVAALHAQAKSESWKECQSRIHRELRLHSSPSSITVIPRVLEKIPILIFAGDQDFICNYMGLENMIQAMTWNGETGLGVRQFFDTAIDLFLNLLFLFTESGDADVDC